MTQFDFDFNLALSLYESPEEFPVNFDDAWPWLDYKAKSDAKVSFRGCGFTKSIDFISFQDSTIKPQGGRPKEIIKMTVECFKMWAMMAGTAAGKEVRLYFLECEKRAKAKTPSILMPTSKELMNDAIVALDLVFSDMQLAPALYAGIKLNTVQAIAPHVASYIEPARQHLINSTATEKTLMTVTQLGQLLDPPLSAIKTNRLLIDKGLQVKNPKKKSKKDASYIPTDLGHPYCDNTLATCANNCDTVQQLRWYDSVLDVI